MPKNIPRHLSAALALLIPIAIVPAAAQSGGVSLAYIPSSSVKIEQVIGDCDFQAQAQQIVKGQTATCFAHHQPDRDAFQHSRQRTGPARLKPMGR